MRAKSGLTHRKCQRKKHANCSSRIRPRIWRPLKSAERSTIRLSICRCRLSGEVLQAPTAYFTTMPQIDLPLRFETPLAWAAAALESPLELLNDHAHLEKKAAANALELLNRWPEPNPPENWVAAMTAIARDEVEHLAMVCRILARRGARLSRSHRNEYASRLRGLVRKGAGPGELVDRLMVSALIEARSCERFLLLSRACADAELARLYRGLWASEHGH